MNFLWILVFIISLYLLIKGADCFLVGAEKIGLFFGLSPFIVGVTIVAMGTSFPELFTAIAAGMKGVTEAIPANAIGSNITNILLVVGISAVIGGKLTVSKNLIDVELPLLATGTVILLGVIWPWRGEEVSVVTRPESILLVLTYLSYLLYTILHKEPGDEEIKKSRVKVEKITAKDYLFLFGGLLSLSLGAKFLMDSVIEISEMFGVAVGVVSILAVALGTSLPELVVSVRAALQKRPEIALGNIFGSNAFNSFMVIGIPGIFTTIQLDEPTFMIGVPMMGLVTLLFVISGISKRIHSWEGLFFISLYLLFVGKILNIF